VISYRSTVHGIMDLETGHIWKYGDINWLDDDQISNPMVKEAILKHWLVEVSGAELRQAMSDPNRRIGPKPPSKVNVSNTPAVSVSEFEDLKAQVGRLAGIIEEVFNQLVGLRNKVDNVHAPLQQNAKPSAPLDNSGGISLDAPVFVPKIKTDNVPDIGSVKQESSGSIIDTDSAVKAIKKIKKK